MRYLGVSRAESFSPNRVSGDTAVFRAVAGELERRGNEVSLITEHDLAIKGIPDGLDGIFQMARSREALAVLERSDVPVTNTVQAVINCGRATQTGMLKETGLIPDSLICRTGVTPDQWHSFPCWVKRADSHAVEQDDVRFVKNDLELSAVLKGFAVRGIGECVIQNHAVGWLVKFYGVRGAGLVDCHAASVREGKFGLERYNEQPDNAVVDMDALTSAAERASDILGVDVFGGDAVVGHDGEITIVDFNDWPSFHSCTVGAAQKIAELIIDKNR